MGGEIGLNGIGEDTVSIWSVDLLYELLLDAALELGLSEEKGARGAFRRRLRRRGLSLDRVERDELVSIAEGSRKTLTRLVVEVGDVS